MRARRTTGTRRIRDPLLPLFAGEGGAKRPIRIVVKSPHPSPQPSPAKSLQYAHISADPVGITSTGIHWRDFRYSSRASRSVQPLAMAQKYSQPLRMVIGPGGREEG